MLKRPKKSLKHILIDRSRPIFVINFIIRNIFNNIKLSILFSYYVLINKCRNIE